MQHRLNFFISDTLPTANLISAHAHPDKRGDFSPGNDTRRLRNLVATTLGEIIFSVGKDFTLTADQILELLERGELNGEGVRRSVEAHASATRR
jgi:hypothetical protein